VEQLEQVTFIAQLCLKSKVLDVWKRKFILGLNSQRLGNNMKLCIINVKSVLYYIACIIQRWASIAFTVNFRNNVFKYTIQGEFPAERGILRFATMRFDDSSLSVQLILGNDTSINSCVKEVKVNVGCQLKYEAIKQAFSGK